MGGGFMEEGEDAWGLAVQRRAWGSAAHVVSSSE